MCFTDTLTLQKKLEQKSKTLKQSFKTEKLER